jgi:hypothetical protein
MMTVATREKKQNKTVGNDDLLRLVGDDRVANKCRRRPTNDQFVFVAANPPTSSPPLLAIRSYNYYYIYIPMFSTLFNAIIIPPLSLMIDAQSRLNYHRHHLLGNKVFEKY